MTCFIVTYNFGTDVQWHCCQEHLTYFHLLQHGTFMKVTVHSLGRIALTHYSVKCQVMCEHELCSCNGNGGENRNHRNFGRKGRGRIPCIAVGRDGLSCTSHTVESWSLKGIWRVHNRLVRNLNRHQFKKFNLCRHQSLSLGSCEVLL